MVSAIFIPTAVTTLHSVAHDKGRLISNGWLC